MSDNLKFKVGDRAMIEGHRSIPDGEVEIVALDESDVPYKVRGRVNDFETWSVAHRLSPLPDETATEAQMKPEQGPDEIAVEARADETPVEAETLITSGTSVRVTEHNDPMFGEIGIVSYWLPQEGVYCVGFGEGIHQKRAFYPKSKITAVEPLRADETPVGAELRFKVGALVFVRESDTGREGTATVVAVDKKSSSDTANYRVRWPDGAEHWEFYYDVFALDEQSSETPVEAQDAHTRFVIKHNLPYGSPFVAESADSGALLASTADTALGLPPGTTAADLAESPVTMGAKAYAEDAAQPLKVNDIVEVVEPNNKQFGKFGRVLGYDDYRKEVVVKFDRQLTFSLNRTALRRYHDPLATAHDRAAGAVSKLLEANPHIAADVRTGIAAMVKRNLDEMAGAGETPVEAEYTGSSVSYYRVKIESPSSPDVVPYTAECNDIIEALGLNYAEGNVLKALWRRAAHRQGKGKKGYTDGLYDAEKMVYFSERVLAQESTKRGDRN